VALGGDTHFYERFLVFSLNMLTHELLHLA